MRSMGPLFQMHLSGTYVDMGLHAGCLHATDSISRRLCQLQLCPHQCGGGHRNHLPCLVLAQIWRQGRFP